MSIPNKEVLVGLIDGLIPAYTGLDGSSVKDGFALKFYRALRRDDMTAAMDEIGYTLILQKSEPLLNGKALVRLDFKKNEVNYNE